MTFRIIQGDNRDVLKTIETNSIDAIVTDPPYGIDFLGKEWDANTGALETYQECLRVLKPGGHILAFSAARTYHHLAITLEQAGFEIRDQIMWIYSSGFPKSQDVGKSIERSEQKIKNKSLMIPAANSNSVSINTKCSKCNKPHGTITLTKKCENIDCPVLAKLKPADNEWAGWGTALKPAHEPIALARKPLHKNNSIAKNCQQWGVGALNIDACRVGDDTMIIRHLKKDDGKAFTHHGDGKKNWDTYEDVGTVEGRFPSNVLGDIPDYQKYFYCPKVSRKERHIGFDTSKIPSNPDGMCDNGVQFQENKQGLITNDEMLEKMGGHWLDDQGNQVGSEREGSKMLWLPHTGAIFTHGLKHEYEKWCKANVNPGNVGNNHPTVKPVALMEYLIKLITPPGGTVLDPFNGSGSTGMAATGLGFDYVGIELDPNYVKIAETRIQAWLDRDLADNNFEELFDATE